MPPKAKVTKGMILDAALALVRTEGAPALNVRAISQRLDCSTQPVMYHFPRMELLKREVYARADLYHTSYLTNLPPNCDDPMLEIGLRYIHFAVEEAPLFRFLFQSNGFAEKNLLALLEDAALDPILTAVQQAAEVDREQARRIFLTVFLFVHGYASMFANNQMDYEETLIASQLRDAFQGAVYVAKKEKT